MLFFPNRFLKEHILFLKYCIFWLCLFTIAYFIPNNGWFSWNFIGLNADLIIILIVFQLESPNFFYHADILTKQPNKGYLWFWKKIDKPAVMRKYSLFLETYFNPIFTVKFYCYIPIFLYIIFCVFNPSWFFFEFLILFACLWLDFYDEIGNDMIDQDIDEDYITPVRYLSNSSIIQKHEYINIKK